MIWNEHTKTMLYLLKSKNRPNDAIAETMSTLLEQPVTVDDVVFLWADMNSGGWIKEREAAKKRARNQASKNYTPQEWQDDRRKLVEANVMHLVDLKRAGHSPRRTELKITVEGAGRRYSTAATSSYLGSSAAACADWL